MDPSLIDKIPPEVLAILAKEDQGPKVVGLVVAFTVLAFICVLLRFFARIKFTIVGLEDYFIALSMLFSIATAACQIKQVGYGAGKHSMFVPLPSIIMSLKYLYFSILTYCVGFTLIKVSILTQYRRIFTVASARIPIYVVMGIAIASGIAAFFTFAFACVPVDANWNILKKPMAKCINEYAARYAHGTSNAVTDLLIAALPVKGIWNLQLVRRQKIALIMVLTLGWFVCIVSILRVHSLYVLHQSEDDPLFYSAPPIYWAAMEMNLAIVCACVPALKPLVVKIIPAFASRRTGNNSTERSTSSKLSKFSHNFQKISGASASSRNVDKDLENGHRGTELDTVTALPAVHRQTANPGHITVTYDMDQQSNRRPSDESFQRLMKS
ncbi:hypothetical protein DE146DRAFT_724657 [Phaeosphaeria sp. MPI-PUGE-AT-0046c]|nr:hypothetical protein DE146DRAFT_724657 [Phaeosphaeria sp. MPI-PUGE-AT-0046c]